MKRTLFQISKMDCPSEEQIIRMSLVSLKSIRKLEFDIPKRIMAATHEGSEIDILNRITPLNFDARVISTLSLEENNLPLIESQNSEDESRILKILLGINFLMFVVELIAGLNAQSTGLISDSFDMAADAVVYGISLYAVGKTLSHQQRAAALSGWFQFSLAGLAFLEILRRLFFGSDPNSQLMIGVSIIALIANVTCLYLLMKHRNGAVHMRASWVFSTNDVIANTGVIIAGVLVYYTQSPWPDLIIGTLVSIVVTRGAISILNLSKTRHPLPEGEL